MKRKAQSPGTRLPQLLQEQVVHNTPVLILRATVVIARRDGHTLPLTASENACGEPREEMSRAVVAGGRWGKEQREADAARVWAQRGPELMRSMGSVR